MRAPRPAVAAIPIAVALIVALHSLTGCGNHRSTRLTPPSATPAAQPPPSGPTSAPPAGGCPSGTATLTWQPDSPPPTPICVHTGTEITVILLGRIHYQWEPLTSSNPQVAAVGDTGQDQEGAAHSTIHAIRSGTAVVTATATSRTEPADPAITWRQSITVTG
jgi:hypothetical protein